MRISSASNPRSSSCETIQIVPIASRHHKGITIPSTIGVSIWLK